MGFAVTRPVGKNDAEFQMYARQLRKHDIDLARVPRVLEPRTHRRWLYYWQTKKEAEAFARELKHDTGDQAWYVEQVNSPPSEGPLGPVILQLGRQSDGLVFDLHPLSKWLLKSGFPESFRSSSIFLDADAWQDYKRKRRGSLTDLTWEMALPLTGLSRIQLQELGLELIDGLTDESVVSVPPSGNGQSGI